MPFDPPGLRPTPWVEGMAKHGGEPPEAESTGTTEGESKPVGVGPGAGAGSTGGLATLTMDP